MQPFVVAIAMAVGLATLTVADNGRSVSVRQGGSVDLRLVANRSTGFQWMLAEASRSCATVVRDDYRSGSAGLMGAPGERRLTLRFDRSGTCPVRLTYMRPWRPGEPADRFTVTVTVK